MAENPDIDIFCFTETHKEGDEAMDMMNFMDSMGYKPVCTPARQKGQTLRAGGANQATSRKYKSSSLRFLAKKEYQTMGLGTSGKGQKIRAGPIDFWDFTVQQVQTDELPVNAINLYLDASEGMGLTNNRKWKR